jgi:hypothetical protein
MVSQADHVASVGSPDSGERPSDATQREGDAATAASADHGREIAERGLQMLCEFPEDFMALTAQRGAGASRE